LYYACQCVNNELQWNNKKKELGVVDDDIDNIIPPKNIENKVIENIIEHGEKVGEAKIGLWFKHIAVLSKTESNQ
jgi:hypothetical protein